MSSGRQTKKPSHYAPDDFTSPSKNKSPSKRGGGRGIGGRGGGGRDVGGRGRGGHGGGGGRGGGGGMPGGRVLPGRGKNNAQVLGGQG